MKFSTLIKVLSFAAGLCFVLYGALWVYLALAGQIKTGGAAGYIASAWFVLIAAPLLAFPFSARAARFLFVLVLFAVAFEMLWLAFQPDLGVSHPALVQNAAIALIVLLIARVGLALRRKFSSSGS